MEVREEKVRRWAIVKAQFTVHSVRTGRGTPLDPENIRRMEEER